MYQIKGELLMKNRKRSLLITVLVNLIFIAAIALVSWKIISYYNDSRRTTELAESLWAEAVITPGPKTEDRENPDRTENPGESSHSRYAGISGFGSLFFSSALADDELPAESEANQQPAALLLATPRFIDVPEIPEAIDFDYLKKQNKEIACWLYQPSTGLNLPVVHTGDNEYYLKRGFTRYHSELGTLFIDYRNKGDFSDRNTIIYGHARKDLTMFGKLHYYKKPEYCKEHPFLYMYVPGYRYRLEIVACVDTTDLSDYYNVPAGDYWEELMDKAIHRSPYGFGIQYSAEDHYVTLSTCAYDYTDERWLVIARIDDPEGTLPAMNTSED